MEEEIVNHDIVMEKVKEELEQTGSPFDMTTVLALGIFLILLGLGYVGLQKRYSKGNKK